MQPIREELHDLFVLVRDGSMSTEDADIHAETIYMDSVGGDESIESRPGFPARWGDKDTESVKKTWVNARNHLRRSMRAKYKG